MKNELEGLTNEIFQVRDSLQKGVGAIETINEKRAIKSAAMQRELYESISKEMKLIKESFVGVNNLEKNVNKVVAGNMYSIELKIDKAKEEIIKSIQKTVRVQSEDLQHVFRTALDEARIDSTKLNKATLNTRDHSKETHESVKLLLKKSHRELTIARICFLVSLAFLVVSLSLHLF